ncbi:CaiB/BaiF CoA transferase family protein [Aliikangiella maris]|uniref:CoA transferase n=2 Tax=Aliikangiella maris TaxID=3162458 RepID=A0ABV3MP37_9GAMM
MAGPLTHIQVLDLSRILAGPWATQFLADLGANVIKVERPNVGDDTRQWGPPFVESLDHSQAALSAYYLSANRGKRSLEVDLSSTEGQQLIYQLVKKSDVIVENFKAGTLKKLGLSYNDLKQHNPQIVYCSITGFGQDGPRHEQAAYDFMIQAMSGLMSITGEPESQKGVPQKVGIPIVDLMTGMYASSAILAALNHRERTGQGEYIDIAMLDVMVSTLANRKMSYLTSGQIPQRTGNRHPNIQPQDVFACQDGYIAIVVGNDQQFLKLCDVIKQPALKSNPHFQSNELRVSHAEQLVNIVAAAFAQADKSYWLDRLNLAGIPCSPINRIDEILNDPQIKHRDLVSYIEHPQFGNIPQMKNPIKFHNATLDSVSSPPLLGEFNTEIAQWLKQSS